MRQAKALYRGEISAHHYFRDFVYCDSGMIHWLLIWEPVKISFKSVGSLLRDCRTRFPAVGELNFTVKDVAAYLMKAEELYGPAALCVDHLDDLSIEIQDQRFNLCKPNTESLGRLNVETRGNADLLAAKTIELTRFIENLYT